MALRFFVRTTPNAAIALVVLVSVYALRRCILIGQGLVFTGIAYLLVYIGAIAILFLFVIILLDTRSVKIGRAFEGRILAFGLGCIVYLPCVLMERDLTLFGSSFDRWEDLAIMGCSLYTEQRHNLLLTGVVLILALVGAVYLSILSH